MIPFVTVVFQEEENFRVTPTIANILGASSTLKGDRVETIIFDPNDMSLNFATHNMYRFKVEPKARKKRNVALVQVEKFIWKLMNKILESQENNEELQMDILKEIYIEAFLEEIGGNE